MIDMIPTPKSLGLPSKFKEWRPNQWQAIMDGLDCERRVAIQVQRGGRGKTATYMTQGLIKTDWRVIYLTSNKGLQDQALEDWSSVGLTDIRGKASYSCDGLPGRSCEDGSVSKCIYKSTSMCGYNDAVHRANEARLLCSNYSCWIAANKYGKGFGTFDMMVCDEAHNIPAEVAKAMRIQLSGREIDAIKREWPEIRNTMASWKQWAAVSLIISEKELQRLKEEVEKPGKPSPSLVARYKQARNFSRKLADIATCRIDKWVCGEWNYGYQFDVIDAAEYTERILFRKVPKLILTSGTVRPKTAEMCGFKPEDYEFFDYPSTIDPGRSPLMMVKTGVKVSRNTPDYMLNRLVRWIDKIIDGRQDRKGIIHTANFKIRDYVVARSKYGTGGSRIMDTNRQGEDKISDIIRGFKAAKAPRVLISPSVTTGFDFPFDQCRYQIIVKLPYEDISSEVVQARLELDPKHAAYNMMQNLAQAFSRGDRGDEDQQEVFVLDENLNSAMWWYADLAPSWLPAYYSVVDNVPDAPVLEALCL